MDFFTRTGSSDKKKKGEKAKSKKGSSKDQGSAEGIASFLQSLGNSISGSVGNGSIRAKSINKNQEASRASTKSKRGAKSKVARSGIVAKSGINAGNQFSRENVLMEYRSATLGTQLTEALADDTLADVTFIVGPERKVVKGLRIVIAARNKFFKSMLYESKMEDGSLQATFELPSAHAVSFDLMMKFIHAGGISWEPHQTVQLLEVSIDFQVEELMKKCMELVSESMTDNLSLAELTKLIQILLRGEGFDVNLQHPKTGTSALHVASREGGVELVIDLLSRGANLNWTDIHGATAMHLARNAEVAQLLINAKADVFAADKGGNPPLVYSIVHKRKDVAELLLAMNCGEALFRSVQEKNDTISRKLNKGRVTPITEVKTSPTMEALLKVIEQEAELYPLMISPPSLIEVARAGSTWGTKSALARDEDVNQRDDREAAKLSLPGYTALHWAAAMGHFGVIQCLLSSDDIEINPTDTEEEDGYTPLQLCINYRQRQWEACAALMRAHGAKERASFESDEDEDEDEEMEGASMSKTSINRGKTSGSSAPTTAFFSRVFNNRITSAVSKIVARPSTSASKKWQSSKRQGGSRKVRSSHSSSKNSSRK
ncbi:hypothetical protein GUITHDRAFT_134570 [Guillardia theta CCMP2712]|uniref:BTB domain-containing protein n=1 Tax=Guillardia theta (strain CCMP2712) TaxID=905079 RepID=L1JSY8_GUITC|nr:hypothetical protein GUITHDRAFT_134570 [Guillardia theta CCMP2712]EKX51686.1 hypothetical protein GUITHDRAFT_134570 [Guillardia theta CCMP2712]|eukprot:XP_005838666.1 hypothetical protein GUITHDRAFT_134570 [Guillardia theta CCMP2712]